MSNKEELEDDNWGADMEDFTDDDDGLVKIYPGPDHHRYSSHRLTDLCERAIDKYNRKKGNTFMFVELVEGLFGANFEADNVITFFKARQSDAMIVTFRAETYFTSKDLSDPHPHLHIKVAPFNPESRSYQYDCSDSESAESAESEPESESLSYQTEKLGTHVGLLHISSSN